MTQIEERLKAGVTFVPAVVCYLKKGDKVLLGLRKEVSLKLGENKIGGIGGKVGDHPEYQNETPEEALAREVLEEIKVRIKIVKKMGRVRFIYVDKPKWQQDVSVYVVEEWEGEPQETVAIQPLWFDTEALPTDRMWYDNSYWVPRVLAGEQVDAIFLLDDDGKVLEYVFQ